jgi:hypothetical protein
MSVPRSTPASWLRVRHRGAVLALVAAPLAGLAWSMLVPLFTGSMANEVANLAASPTRFVTATYLGVLMSFLMVPALLALARLLRPSAPVASDVAAVVGGFGACFHGALLVFQLAEVTIIAAIPDQQVATTVVSKMFEHPAFQLVLAPFMAFYLALAAFAVLLLVRRAVSPWIPVMILVAIPIELASPILWKARLFFAMLLLAFTGIAVAVSRLGASEWARRGGASADESDAALHDEPLVVGVR